MRYIVLAVFLFVNSAYAQEDRGLCTRYRIPVQGTPVNLDNQVEGAFGRMGEQMVLENDPHMRYVAMPSIYTYQDIRVHYTLSFDIKDNYGILTLTPRDGVWRGEDYFEAYMEHNMERFMVRVSEIYNADAEQIECVRFNTVRQYASD